MADILLMILSFSIALVAVFALLFLISSLWEGERRAVLMAGLTLGGLIGLGVGLLSLRGTGFYSSLAGLGTLLGGIAAIGGALAVVLRKTSPNPRALEGTKGYRVGEVQRFDERAQVFARNRSLPPGSEQYRAFYQEHPGWEAGDARRRQRGGPIGDPGTIDRPHDRPNVAAGLAAFTLPFHLGRAEICQPEGHPHFGKQRTTLRPEEATVRVKGLARHLGADLVGIARLDPSWVYGRRGEIFYGDWERWGQEIRLDHPYAVVFAMEMAREMVWSAPHTPTLLESAVVYALGATVATELAAFIANLGYSATSHHIRHYDLLLVPVAVDAGLGEVGRLGYLITKAFGPRVRLGCVTTDLPLVADRPVDIGVEDFCRGCEKCARCCPSGSIPFGRLQEVHGTLRWKLNAETCFDYWGKVGTDCNICMRVCPWSHPRTLPHRVIIEMVTRNGIARRLFSSMDDLFYGKRPKSFPGPRWARYGADPGEEQG